MNCAQFQQVLPEVLEGDRTVEQASHLRSCPVCSSLVADLDLIASEARELQELDEPSPRVWNSIEIALRQEGIIRDPHLGPSLVPPVPRRWRLAWLAPVAAILVVGFGIGVYRHAAAVSPSAQSAATTSLVASNLQGVKNPPIVNSSEDDQFLAAVAKRSPAMKAQYATNLQNVNAYIRDAEASAEANPNDEEAQQIVMDAYEQRATVYELALDRSMP